MTRLILKLALAGLAFAGSAFATGPASPPATPAGNGMSAHGTTMRSALAVIAQPAGVYFMIAPGLEDDAVSEPPPSGDWPTVIRSVLKGYNFIVTQHKSGRLAEIRVTGRSGDGHAMTGGEEPVEPLLRYGPPPKALPDALRNRKTESVYAVDLPVKRLREGKPGDRLAVNLPDGRYQAVQDNAWQHTNGDVTWIARLDGLSVAYRALITLAADGTTYGRIVTPGGVYQLLPGDDQAWLVDVGASGLTPVPMAGDDAKPGAAASGATDVGIAAAGPQKNAAKAAAGAESGPVIDLLILYNRGMDTPHFPTRLNYLIDLVNQALADSQVAARMRVARTKRIRYPSGEDSSTALDKLTERSGTFAGVSRLRRRSGADVVVLLRPFRSSSQGDVCGIAWVNGSDNTPLTPSQAYAVVSDGSDQRYFCSDYTLAHEIGHTLGAAHDRDHSNVPGHFSYSYGYGVNGRFGDIMSYYSPEVGLFANPEIIACDGNPCGIPATRPRGADLAATFSRTAADVAGFQP